MHDIRGETMTYDEARATMRALTGATDQDIADYEAASPDDRDAIVQGLKAAMAEEQLSAFQIFEQDLRIASNIASELLPIASLAAAIIAL